MIPDGTGYTCTVCKKEVKDYFRCGAIKYVFRCGCMAYFNMLPWEQQEIQNLIKNGIKTEIGKDSTE